MRGTKLQSEARVNSLIRKLVDGIADWDVEAFVREEEAKPESPWFIAEGETPRGYKAVMKTLRKARQTIAARGISDVEQLRRLAVAQQDSLYQLALAQGDIRAANMVLRDRNKLLGLFPKEQGRGGKGRTVTNFILQVVESPKPPPLPLAEVVDEESQGTLARLEVAPDATRVHAV